MSILYYSGGRREPLRVCGRRAHIRRQYGRHASSPPPLRAAPRAASAPLAPFAPLPPLAALSACAQHAYQVTFPVFSYCLAIKFDCTF